MSLPVSDRCQPPGRHHSPSSRPASERRHDEEEARLPLSPEKTREEATRCLASLTCSWCNVCILICPDLCLTRDPHTLEIRIDLDYCKGCGLCALYCPKDALQMVQEETS